MVECAFFLAGLLLADVRLVGDVQFWVSFCGQLLAQRQYALRWGALGRLTGGIIAKGFCGMAYRRQCALLGGMCGQQLQ